MLRKSCAAGLCSAILVGLTFTMLPLAAIAAHRPVAITWVGSQHVGMGDDIKTAAKRLGEVARHDFPTDCGEYGTFHHRHVTFHTDRWPAITSFSTVRSVVRLSYGIRVGQSVHTAKSKLPQRLTWHGPIKSLLQYDSERVWYAQGPHHRLLAIWAAKDGNHIVQAGVYRSKSAIIDYDMENC